VVVKKELDRPNLAAKTFVEEINLQIQVSALRRASAPWRVDGPAIALIMTVPGRGYNFGCPGQLRATAGHCPYDRADRRAQPAVSR